MVTTTETDTLQTLAAEAGIAPVSGETSAKLRALLREVLTLPRIPKDLRARIEVALARQPRTAGPGRDRQIDYDRVQELREKGTSDAEIARTLGVTRQAISKIPKPDQ